MRRALLVLLACAVLVPPAAAARHPRQTPTKGTKGRGKAAKANQLMIVRAPVGRGPAAAHPFVNVIVRFGYDVGTPDPATFRARLGGVNITRLFEDVYENGRLAGKRAAVGPALLIVGRGTNRLRLEVRGRIGKHRVRDVDRVRFTAEDVPDQVPAAHALAGSDVILPGVPIQFDGTQSSDPESDELTYSWEFGDGTTSTDASPVHVFGPATADMAVRLTVNDTQLQASDQVTLYACPAVCEGCTRGTLKIEASSALEFGAVGLGASGTRTFTVRNTDAPGTCSWRRCNTNLAMPCAADADCGTGTCIEAGRCSATTTTACAGDASCPAGEACQRPTCCRRDDCADATTPGSDGRCSTPESDLHVRLGTGSAGFRLVTTDLHLCAGKSAPVDVVFAPNAAAHQSANLTLVACAANQSVVHLLAHGFGGDAPGTGPLPAADTVFYNTVSSGTFGIHPDGSRFFADNTVHACQVPQNGLGSGDACVTDTDCADPDGNNRGSCPATGSCIRGDRAGEPCTRAADCPAGFCSSALPLDPVKMCGDGEGGLYLMSDEGTYTDFSPRDDALSGTVMHVTFDASGNRTGAQIVYRTTENTAQMACDGVPAAAGGQIYIAEYRALPDTDNCFRDSREALVALRKSNGFVKTALVLSPRIDAAEGLDPCNDDYDPADDLEVSRDGAAVFVALPNGISRIRPTTLLMTPDIDDVFQVHPDGSVLVVTTLDVGPTGLLHLYKISPDQAANGAPHLSDLTPCATVSIPNNGPPGGGRRLTTFVSYAVDPVAPGSSDATVLVSFFAGGASTALQPSLRVQGTYAIAAPAGSNACTPIGLVNLEPLDQLTF